MPSALQRDVAHQEEKIDFIHDNTCPLTMDIVSELRDGLAAVLGRLDSRLKTPIKTEADVQFHALVESMLVEHIARSTELLENSRKASDEYIAAVEELVKNLKNYRSGVIKPKAESEPALSVVKFDTTNLSIVKFDNIESPQIEQFPSLSKLEDAGSWKTVVRSGKPNNKPERTTKVNQAGPKFLGSGLVQTPVAKLVPATKHEVYPGIWIPSNAIKDPEDCLRDENLGRLCYHTETRRCLMGMNGIIYPAGVGEVLWRAADLHRPVKSSEFDPNKNCPPKDYNNYYFPPEIEYGIDHPYPDQRNFPTSMVYCPASEHTAYPAIRVGDPSRLIEDLTVARESDLRYALDKCGHDMLIGYLIRLYYKK